MAKEGLGKIRMVCPRTTTFDNEMIISKMSDMTMDEAYAAVNNVIMAHIEACIAEYPETHDYSVSDDSVAGFEDFVKTSPIYAYTNA